MFHPFSNIRYGIQPNNPCALAEALAVDPHQYDGRRMRTPRFSNETLAKMRAAAGPRLVWPISAGVDVTVAASSTETVDLLTVSDGLHVRGDVVRFLIFVVGGASYVDDLAWQFKVNGRPVSSPSNFYYFELRPMSVPMVGGDVLQFAVTKGGRPARTLRVEVETDLVIEPTYHEGD